MNTQTSVSSAVAAAEREAPEYLSGELSESETRDRLAYAIGLGQRIKELRGDLSRSDFGAAIGVHENTVGKYERGASMPDAYLVGRMCQLRSRPVEWLVNGGQSFDNEPKRSVTALEIGGFVYVPQFDITASAGGGAFNDVEQVIAMRPFATQYIREELHILHNDIALLGITGSSGEPELHAGDTIMVDRRDREVRSEGLHLLLVDDTLLVKIVQRLPGRVLRVSSRNDRYPPFEIRLEEESQRNVDIVGRVRWGGITFH